METNSHNTARRVPLLLGLLVTSISGVMPWSSKRKGSRQLSVTDEPEDSGGYGYDHNKEPNPECPRCNGDGIGQPYSLIRANFRQLPVSLTPA